jgi:hypothetical protein
MTCRAGRDGLEDERSPRERRALRRPVRVGAAAIAATRRPAGAAVGRRGRPSARCARVPDGWPRSSASTRRPRPRMRWARHAVAVAFARPGWTGSGPGVAAVCVQEVQGAGVLDRVHAVPGLPPEVRRVIYTTNLIESMNARLRNAGRTAGRGRTMRPPGSSSPVSSNTMTPLHSRLHPCSGWAAMVRAAA